MKTPGKVYSSDEIYRAIWKDEPYGYERAQSRCIYGIYVKRRR